MATYSSYSEYLRGQQSQSQFSDHQNGWWTPPTSRGNNGSQDSKKQNPKQKSAKNQKVKGKNAKEENLKRHHPYQLLDSLREVLIQNNAGLGRNQDAEKKIEVLLEKTSKDPHNSLPSLIQAFHVWLKNDSNKNYPWNFILNTKDLPQATRWYPEISYVLENCDKSTYLGVVTGSETTSKHHVLLYQSQRTEALPKSSQTSMTSDEKFEQFKQSYMKFYVVRLRDLNLLSKYVLTESFAVVDPEEETKLSLFLISAGNIFHELMIKVSLLDGKHSFWFGKDFSQEITVAQLKAWPASSDKKRTKPEAIKSAPQREEIN